MEPCEFLKIEELQKLQNRINLPIHVRMQHALVLAHQLEQYSIEFSPALLAESQKITTQQARAILRKLNNMGYLFVNKKAYRNGYVTSYELTLKGSRVGRDVYENPDYWYFLMRAISASGIIRHSTHIRNVYA